MATAVPGPLVSDVRGTIGTTTFRVQRGKQVAQGKPVPPVHNTDPAIAAKDRFQRATGLWWPLLRDEFDVRWRAYSKAQGLPPTAAWTRVMCDWQLGRLSEFPSPDGVGMTDAAVVAASGSVVSIAFTLAAGEANIDGAGVIVTTAFYESVLPSLNWNFWPAANGRTAVFDTQLPAGFELRLAAWPYRDFGVDRVIGRGYSLSITTTGD